MEKYNYFPMFVDISQKRILVIGGGKIAARRIRTLMKFAADIVVISREAGELLTELIKKDADSQITYICREVCEEEFLKESDENPLNGMDIVLAATDNSRLNRKIAESCRKRQILVNISDDKELCDFYFPAVTEKDGVVIGINSGGKSPEKVRKVRECIDRQISF